MLTAQTNYLVAIHMPNSNIIDMENKMNLQKEINSMNILYFEEEKSKLQKIKMACNTSDSIQEVFQRTLDENITLSQYRQKIDLLIKVASEMIEQQNKT